MSAPSDANPYAYEYAKFLVDLFPEFVYEILGASGTCDVTKLVEEKVNYACRILGGSRHEIKGMIENTQWEDLRERKRKRDGGPSSDSSTTPKDYGARPPTPSSTASGSPQSRRISHHDWICVYHMSCKVTLTSKPSGLEDFLIGEDKLSRFPDMPVGWIEPPKPIIVGGRRLDIARYVNLTWNHTGEGGTRYNQFWVVPSGIIRLADVLLGYRPHVRHDKGAGTSPLSLEPRMSQMPPPAPTPPQLTTLYQAREPSVQAIFSIPGATVRDFGQAQSQQSTHLSNFDQPLRSTGRRTATIASAPLTEQHSRPMSQRMDHSPARPGSALSNRSSRSSKLNMVTTVHLSFEGAGKRLLPLDLSRSADEVIPYLEPHILKMSGRQLDRSIHDIKITPLKDDAPEPETSSLSDIDYLWDTLVEFMSTNRTNDKTPEFQVAVFRPPGT